MKDFSPLDFTSAVVGFPARLCTITLTNGAVKRIAESDESITVSGETFTPVAGLNISAVKHTSNGEMPSCQITGIHGSSATINSADLDIGLYDGADVQLYIVDRLNLTRKGLLFSGSIAPITYDPLEKQVIFDVKGPAVVARRLITQKRSPMCRTDLFSVLCGANPASYIVTATIATIEDSFTFTLSGMSITPPADGYFNGGVALTSGGTAFELANWVLSTSKITAYLACNRILTVGSSLTLYPGCNKTMDANGCPKFSNQLNFQGEPHFLGTAAAAQQV